MRREVYLGAVNKYNRDISTTISNHVPLEAQFQMDRQVECETDVQQTLRMLIHKFIDLLFVCNVAVISGC